MATRQALLLRAVEAVGDDPADLICFYQDQHGESWDDSTPTPIIRCQLADLPIREFDRGYGRTEGEPCIAFSKRYVYVCWQYDGAEGMEAIPRNPEDVASIPWPGG